LSNPEENKISSLPTPSQPSFDKQDDDDDDNDDDKE
jgi:hypothetical protein